jgi:hypothetical protein
MEASQVEAARRHQQQQALEKRRGRQHQHAAAPGAVLGAAVLESSQPGQRHRTARAVATERLEALSVIGPHRGVGVQREAVGHRQPRARRVATRGHVHQQRLTALEECRVVILEVKALDVGQAAAKLAQGAVQHGLDVARVGRRQGHEALVDPSLSSPPGSARSASR